MIDSYHDNSKQGSQRLCPVVSVVVGLPGRSRAEPDGREADAEAGEVGEEVGSVGHDGEAVRQVATDDLTW